MPTSAQRELRILSHGIALVQDDQLELVAAGCPRASSRASDATCLLAPAHPRLRGARAASPQRPRRPAAGSPLRPPRVTAGPPARLALAADGWPQGAGWQVHDTPRLPPPPPPHAPEHAAGARKILDLLAHHVDAAVVRGVQLQRHVLHPGQQQQAGGPSSPGVAPCKRGATHTCCAGGGAAAPSPAGPRHISAAPPPGWWRFCRCPVVRTVASAAAGSRRSGA